MSKDFHVIIIGGGAAGLLIAQGLTVSGISHTVYERNAVNSSEFRKKNWTMALHWGNQHIKSLLPVELRAELKNVEPDPDLQLPQEDETSFPFVNGKTGDVVTKVQGETVRRANKEKLRQLFSRGIDIKYDKKLVDIVHEGDKVRAQFEDGTEAVGDMLVGCDAGESVVRKWLLGPEKSKLETMPLEFYNFTQTYTAEQARFIRSQYHPLIKISIHPDEPVFFNLVTYDVPDPDDASTWGFQLLISRWGTKAPATSAERLVRVKEITKSLCEPFRSAAQWVKEDTQLTSDNITQWSSITPWPNHGGRITLAGDAAHCIAPYRGQGLNNALGDAGVFVQALRSLQDPENGGRVDSARLKAAVDAYDADVFERGQREIGISSRMAWASHSWADFMKSPIVTQGLHAQKQREMSEGVAAA